MFVGYALNHDGDCYRMWDPRTEGVHVTRDVIWLKRMFYEKPKINADVVVEPLLMDFEEMEEALLPTEEDGEGNGNDNTDDEEEEEGNDEDAQDAKKTTRYG